jgi:hypothetical protein
MFWCIVTKLYKTGEPKYYFKAMEQNSPKFKVPNTYLHLKLHLHGLINFRRSLTTFNVRVGMNTTSHESE